MMTTKPRWTVPLFVAVALGCATGSLLCERARWPHEDGIWGTGDAVPPQSAAKVAHERASDRLHVATIALTAAAALFLAGALFMVCPPPARVTHALVALAIGGMTYVILCYMGLSIMDDDLAEQRPYALAIQGLSIVALGAFLASGILGLSSKRLLGAVAGLIGLTAAAFAAAIATGP